MLDKTLLGYKMAGVFSVLLFSFFQTVSLAASGPSAYFKFYEGEGGLRVPSIVSGPGIPQGNKESAQRRSLMSHILYSKLQE